MSELEQIRNALGLNLEDMGRLLGAKSHSTVHRWEGSPDAKSSRIALERAKEVYRKKKGVQWVSPAAPGPAVTREEFDALLRRLSVLESGFQAVSLTPSGLKDLDERVLKVERHAGFRE